MATSINQQPEDSDDWRAVAWETETEAARLIRSARTGGGMDDMRDPEFKRLAAAELLRASLTFLDFADRADREADLEAAKDERWFKERAKQ